MLKIRVFHFSLKKIEKYILGKVQGIEDEEGERTE